MNRRYRVTRWIVRRAFELACILATVAALHLALPDYYR